jgi:guanylate cyclase soluble subunit beta
MKKLAAALDQEKKKTDMLLYQMLPVKVANQLRDGKTVQAGALKLERESFIPK